MRAADRPTRFPFEEALGLGITCLRLSPEAFWSLSPREFFGALRMLLGETGRVETPVRASLEALMKRYPDHPF